MLFVREREKWLADTVSRKERRHNTRQIDENPDG